MASLLGFERHDTGGTVAAKQASWKAHKRCDVHTGDRREKHGKTHSRSGLSLTEDQGSMTPVRPNEQGPFESPLTDNTELPFAVALHL